MTEGELAPGTDVALLVAGHATITALRSTGDHEDLMTGDLGRSVGALRLG